MRQRRAVSFLAWAFGSYAALALAAFFAQRALMYPAPRRTALVPRGPNVELERIASANGDVFALYARGPEDAPTLVHFHGNGEDLGDLPELARAFTLAGASYYAVEYPGYGFMRDRSPSEAALYAAAETALEHLRTKLGISAAHTVLVGQSLGSGVAAEMARRGHAARLVLISPFTSMTEMAARVAPILPARLLVRDRYDTAAKAAELALPALVIHGTEDEVVPYAMGERLAALLPRATLRPIRGGRHNDLFVVAPELIGEIARFASAAR